MKQTFFLLIFIPLSIFSQNETKDTVSIVNGLKIVIDNQDESLFPIKTYIFEKDCSEGGQQDIILCLIDRIEILKNILEEKYNQLLSNYDENIKNYLSDSSIVSDYSQYKELLIASQISWEKSKETNEAFWNSGGGTITNLYIAQSTIEDLKNRIRWIEGVVYENGLGEESENK